MNRVLKYEHFYGGTQQPPFPQTESQHNSFKVLCGGNLSQHNILQESRAAARKPRDAASVLFR